MNNPAKITAQLKEVTHIAKLCNPLESYSIDKLQAGCMQSKSSFLIHANGDEYAISQWVSPKRTRSYPFARVYDTLHKKTKVTLIPFCKDEGADGDRDFIQWDTVALMSLLNVYVIVCYYTHAEKTCRPAQQHKNKITKQLLNYDYVCNKLLDLKSYQSSALHWNVSQLENLSEVAELTVAAYQRISKQTGVKLHSEDGIINRASLVADGAVKFKEMSRKLAKNAQNRETVTDQPKEKTIGSKASVTIRNMLGNIIGRWMSFVF